MECASSPKGAAGRLPSANCRSYDDGQVISFPVLVLRCRSPVSGNGTVDVFNTVPNALMLISANAVSEGFAAPGSSTSRRRYVQVDCGMLAALAGVVGGGGAGGLAPDPNSTK